MAGKQSAAGSPARVRPPERFLARSRAAEAISRGRRTTINDEAGTINLKSSPAKAAHDEAATEQHLEHALRALGLEAQHLAESALEAPEKLALA